MDVPKLTPKMMATFSPEALAFIQLLLAKIAELEEKLNQNSRNSSKPPSSDGPAVKPAPPKPVTGKKHGGQPGHPKQSRTLIPADAPRIVAHGALTAAAALVGFWAVWNDYPANLAEAQVVAFCVLGFAQLLCAFSCRSREQTVAGLGLFTNPALLRNSQHTHLRAGRNTRITDTLNAWPAATGSRYDPGGVLRTPRRSRSHPSDIAAVDQKRSHRVNRKFDGSQTRMGVPLIGADERGSPWPQDF